MARLVLLCAALLLTLPPTTQAAGPASPAEVVRRFAADLNAPYEQARPCRWLSERVRPLVDSPFSFGVEPWLASIYAPQPGERRCDLWVLLYGALSGSDRDGFRTRVAVTSTSLFARRGGVVQFRVGLGERHGERRRLRQSTTDVFLLRERGAWRIVAAGRLWRMWSGNRPRSLAELPRHLRRLRRAGRAVRAAEQALIRRYLRLRTPIATTPLPLPASGSSREDPLHDVLGPRLRRIADQHRATVDLRGASLSTEGGTVAFELRFRDVVPEEAEIELLLTQLRRRAGTPLPVPVPVEGRWRVSLHDGWASAWDLDERLIAIRGLRASAEGGTLRLLGGADLRGRYGRIDLSRPLTWSVRTIERIPGSELPGDSWSDQVPSWDGPAGTEDVAHPPPG